MLKYVLIQQILDCYVFILKIITYFCKYIIINQIKNYKKTDLIKGIAQKAGITNEQAQNALEATLDLIKQSVVEQEDRITLHGFGTFAPSVRKARTGINLATKEKVEIPECKVVKFKASKDAWF